MNGLTGALLGVMLAGGVLLIAAGLRGTTAAAKQTAVLDWRASARNAVAALGAAAVGWAVTGWVAVAGLAAGVAVIAPRLAGTKARREQAQERSEALASWAEMLRDTVSAHAGLREAISITAKVAPRAIREDVQRLSARAEREQLTKALRQFATEVGDPVADLIVSALVIASDRQAHRLSELLSQIAASAREQVGMRIRIETGRARTYASARALVLITFGFAIVLMLFSPTYMEPYDSMAGQFVLMMIAALFAGALWGLVQLGRPSEAPRILAGVEREPAR
jgi:Flp pilus assembly protein TadB